MSARAPAPSNEGAAWRNQTRWFAVIGVAICLLPLLPVVFGMFGPAAPWRSTEEARVEARILEALTRNGSFNLPELFTAPYAEICMFPSGRTADHFSAKRASYQVQLDAKWPSGRIDRRWAIFSVNDAGQIVDLHRLPADRVAPFKHPQFLEERACRPPEMSLVRVASVPLHLQTSALQFEFVR